MTTDERQAVYDFIKSLTLLEVETILCDKERAPLVLSGLYKTADFMEYISVTKGGVFEIKIDS